MPSPDTSIERKGVIRSLPAETLFVAGDRLVHVDGDTIRMGDADQPVPGLRGVGVDPRGRIWIARADGLYTVAQRLGDDASAVRWIQPANTRSWMRVGEHTAWLLSREMRQATSHGLTADGPKRLGEVALDRTFADAVLGPDDDLWWLDSSNAVRRAHPDGTVTKVAQLPGPAERLAWLGGVLHVLLFDGSLVRVVDGTSTRVHAFDGYGVGLLGEADALFVLTSPAPGSTRLHRLSVDGTVVWSTEPFPETGREIVVHDGRVLVTGDESSTTFAHATGARR